MLLLSNNPQNHQKTWYYRTIKFDLSFGAKNITFLAGFIFFANHTENWAIRGKEIGKQINGNFRNLCEGLWIINLVFALAKIRLNLYFLYINVNQKRFQAEHHLQKYTNQTIQR